MVTIIGRVGRDEERDWMRVAAIKHENPQGYPFLVFIAR